MIVDLALAFLAGLLSFASTCVLPLVPAYVAYMGATSNGTATTPRPQLKVLGNAALFVGGFATAFVALGASFGLIGADLKAYRPLLLQIAGAALVLIGIALLTLGRIPGLMGEKRFDIAHRLPRAPWASYVIGLAFAIGWTPCVGPILAAILLRAGSTGTAAQGAVLLAFYSAGLGLPFLIAAGLSGVLTRMLVRVRGAYATLNAVAAVFLIGMGVLIFSNRLTLFNDFFPVVAIDYGNESPDTIRSFWTSLKLQPAPVLDPDGQAAKAYGVNVTLSTGLPVSVLVARDGTVSSYEPFPLTRDYLDPALQKILS